MSALTERDILLPKPTTANVSTFAVESQLASWNSNREPQTIPVEYLSGAAITVRGQRTESAVSPTWLGRVKTRLKELKSLRPNWDSYGAVPVDPRVAVLAEQLVEWFAVADMPPPDVFATGEGGIQIEWHIRRANIEIDIGPNESAPIFFHDLNSGEQWTKPGSSIALQIVRRRLLTDV